jgi:hypothetical protein
MTGVFSNTRPYIILCLSSIAIGLSLSKPLISMGVLGLIFFWVIDGNIQIKLKAFYNNKIAFFLSSIYILTLLGLIYTHNFDYAIGDVRRKTPLFFLPFLLAGFSPLSKKELTLLLKIYIAGVLVASFWSLFVYLGGLGITIVDNRDFSRFNSHIRFGLEIALAIFFSMYYFFKASKFWLKLMWGCIITWLLFSLSLFHLFTGTIVFYATGVVLLIVFGFLSTKKYLKLILVSFLTIIIVSFFVIIKNSVDDFYSSNKVKPLEEIPFTDEGNPFDKGPHSNKSKLKENGYFVDKNISRKEFSAAWNVRSKIDFNGKDLKNQPLRFTLIRFVTSKGERKDKKAIDNLTKKEISAIESGVSNYKYLEMNSFNVRIHKIIWEYDSYKNGRNISGHSVLMRWEYFKTAINIIKKNLLIGVGTGDVQDAFNLQYEQDDSTLTTQYRLRAHNQYLTYGVTFGVLGLIFFITFLIYPIIKTKLYKNYFYLAFFSIIILSMITEDTLETQVGINFFVFFNTIFLLSISNNEEAIN